MKALTLTQPWASLVALDVKRVETRSWSTNYRGPLAIHAAKGLSSIGGRAGLLQAWDAPVFGEELKKGFSQPDEIPLGAVVATAKLLDVRPTEQVREVWRLIGWMIPGEVERELAFGDYSPGRYAWLLTDVRALPEPVPCSGSLGLWDFNGQLEVV